MRQWYGLEININAPFARRRVQLKIPDLGKVGLIPFAPIAIPITNAIVKLINNVMTFGSIAKSFNSKTYHYIKTFAFFDIKLLGRHLRTEEKSKDRLQGILDVDGVI